MAALSSARLAPTLANRTAVTLPLSTAAIKNLIFNDSHHAASATLKDQTHETHHPHYAHQHPTYDDHYSRNAGVSWSTGTKSRADGQLVSRTVYHAPANPFAGKRYHSTTTEMPNWDKYKLSSGHNETTRAFTYMMVGGTGVLSAISGKAFVQDFFSNMSASADVLALAKVEVDLNKIPQGKNLILKWRGKPIFIRHRTSDEIDEANKVDISELRDKETDADRVKDPNYLVMVGVCTHLGCVPIGEAGEFGGWFCPCHGSHYDISGRIRKGPAPLNLAIPDYNITPDNVCVIG